MKISAEVVCATTTRKSGDTGPESLRLSKAFNVYTLKLTMPRFILAELNTHCAFARNSASSRARPLAAVLEKVLEEPFVPEVFLENRPGMSALTPIEDQEAARRAWLDASQDAVKHARSLKNLNVHKQWAARLVEPFLWHEVLVSATEWDNFFLQRLAINPDGSSAAQPEMYQLASKMKAAIDAAELWQDTVHLPFMDERTSTVLSELYTDVSSLNYRKWADFVYYVLAPVSAARCAVISYRSPGSGEIDLAADIRRALKLLTSKPWHPSPFEHVGFSRSKFCPFLTVLQSCGPFVKVGKFLGDWVEFRKLLEVYGVDRHVTILSEVLECLEAPTLY